MFSLTIPLFLLVAAAAVPSSLGSTEISNFCFLNLECGPNASCYSTRCLCDFGHVPKSGTSLAGCRRLACRYHLDCIDGLGDTSTHCQHGQCVCDSGYKVDTFSQKCVHSSSGSSNENDGVGGIVAIIVLVFFLLLIGIWLTHNRWRYGRFWVWRRNRATTTVIVAGASAANAAPPGTTTTIINNNPVPAAAAPMPTVYVPVVAAAASAPPTVPSFVISPPPPPPSSAAAYPPPPPPSSAAYPPPPPYPWSAEEEGAAKKY